MKAIFIFAHPDDESFSSGGTISKLTRSGHLVKLITATKGEAGSLGKPPLTTQDNLGKFRAKELKKAAKVLGINEIFFLNLIDGTLDKIQTREFREMILSYLNKEQPDLVFTFDKHGSSNHPDHKAVSKAATLAFQRYREKAKKHVRLYHSVTPKSYLKKYEGSEVDYRAYGKMKGVHDKNITTTIDIQETFTLKIKAIKAHKTQQQDWDRYLKKIELVDLTKEYFILISENSVV